MTNSNENQNIPRRGDTRYIAALEISSSKIIGAVGKTTGNGKLNVIAVEQDSCTDCVHRGIIQNLEETNIRVNNILDKLENRASIAPRQITGIFAGLAGLSLRNIASDVEKMLPEETEITDEVIASLRTEAMRKPIDRTLEVVDAVPRSFFVNKKETKNPVGTIGNSIRTTYDLIVCHPLIKKNITRVIEEKTKIDLNGFIVTPLAVGHLILTSEEKRLGCMLVDLGAETTTVSFYKNGELCYLATIPLGSRNITRDITSLGILEEKAEEIKTSSGNAMPPEKPSTLNLNGVKLSDVSNLISARAEEIVANIYEQIGYAGLKGEDLPAGIVALGGGFNLHGMVELLEKHCNMKVRRARLPEYVDLEDTRAPMADTIEVISILYAGATLSDKECLTMPERTPVPGNDNPLPGNNDITTAGKTDGKHEETGHTKQKTSRLRSLLDRMGKGLAGAFTPGADDDEDTEIQ